MMVAAAVAAAVAVRAVAVRAVNTSVIRRSRERKKTERKKSTGRGAGVDESSEAFAPKFFTEILVPRAIWACFLRAPFINYPPEVFLVRRTHFWLS